jgi:hypothetical protein
VVTSLDESAWFIPSQADQPDVGTVGRISRIMYSYMYGGAPSVVTACTKAATGSERVLCTNSYSYDQRRSLTRKVKDHADANFAANLAVNYDWDFSPLVTGYAGTPAQPMLGDNCDRPVTIKRPQRVIASRAR